MNTSGFTGERNQSTLTVIMERRNDYILDRTVLVTDHRSNRPSDFRQQSTREEERPCVFCPERVDQTPEDIGRRTDPDGNWQIRWFSNEFPAVHPNPPGATTGSDESALPGRRAVGHHEVIVETPDHDQQMVDYSNEKLTSVLSVYTERIRTRYEQKEIEAVSVFKNKGPGSGASIHHAHSQVLASDFVPRLLKEEQEAFSDHEHCSFCRVIDAERTSERFCFENEPFVAFTPYASRHEYELWIFPRSHAPSWTDVGVESLAPLLKKALQRLRTLNAGYNFILHGDPSGNPFHAHLELYPRTGSWGGFERGTRTMINPVPPEQAAAFYRGELSAS
jgi:UDPglucose--hexose-1-phosphate uridylyltransferase